MDGNHMVLLSFSLVFFFSWNDRNRGPLDKCFFLHQTMSCRFECVCVAASTLCTFHPLGALTHEVAEDKNNHLAPSRPLT